jgi:putative addiction module component (TIGR02574 family)
MIWLMMEEDQESIENALPDEERADLACSLIGSPDDTVDEDVEAAWREEIVRRLEEVRSGKTKTVSWDNVRQKGRALLHGN